ncbi:putative DNA-binding protein [Clostridium sp. DL1XJH146]
MEDKIKISIMLDYYGCLLTDKQNDILDLYVNEDLSLKEISELTKTSRQAVYDIIKRCMKQLLSYENNLKLVQKNSELEKNKNIVIKKLDKLLNNDYKENLQSEIRKIIIDIKEIL